MKQLIQLVHSTIVTRVYNKNLVIKNSAKNIEVLNDAYLRIVTECLIVEDVFTEEEYNKVREPRIRLWHFSRPWKNLQVQLISFYYINVETIGKWKNIYFFKSEKMHKSFLMSFLTIGKWQNIFFFQIWKNAQVFSNEKMHKSI